MDCGSGEYSPKRRGPQSQNRAEEGETGGAFSRHKGKKEFNRFHSSW